MYVRKQIKENMLPGTSGISTEELKCEVNNIIINLTHNILINNEKTTELGESDMIPIPEKGNLSLPSNHFGIAHQMILNRIQPKVDPYLGQNIQAWTNENLWKTAFKKFEGIWSALWSTLSRPYPFKYFKGCLPHILLGPFLNTLSHLRPNQSGSRPGRSTTVHCTYFSSEKINRTSKGEKSESNTSVQQFRESLQLHT